MIPKTHTQAFALLMDELGEAFSNYGHRLHGLDPISPFQTPEQEAMYRDEVESVSRETVEPKKTGVMAARAVVKEYRDTGLTRLGTPRTKEVMQILGEFTTNELADVLGVGNSGAARTIALAAEWTGEKKNTRYDRRQKAKVYRLKGEASAPVKSTGSDYNRMRKVGRKIPRPEIRNYLLTRKGDFTVPALMEEEFFKDSSYDHLAASLRAMSEVSKVGEEATSGRARNIYRFDPSVGQPKAETPQAPERKKIPMHPLRSMGAKKPNIANKDLQKVIDQAWDQGWLVVRTANGHVRYESPAQDAKFQGSTTPSDHLAINNVKKDLRRHGATIS